jgi:hypothetical protein
MLLYSGIFILGALLGYAAGKIDWFVDGMDDRARDGACMEESA